MSSLPDGVTVRPATRADAEAAAAVMRADEEASLGRSRIGAADILEFWRRTNLEQDSWIFEQGRRVVAFGWVHLHGEVAEAAGAVHPDAHRKGLGALLVEQSERRAVEHERARIHQWAVAAEPRALELFEGRGYRDVRRFYEMAIELDEPPPEPELPVGVAIETFHEEEARAFHAATVEA